MSSRPLSVLVAGHLCLDLITSLPGPNPAPGRLSEVGPLVTQLGGCVANTGRALSSLGASVSLAVTVGDDIVGHLAEAQLSNLGLDHIRVEVHNDENTSYSVVIERPDADRSFLHHIGTNASFDGTGVDLTDVDLLHVGYPQLLPALLRNGGRALSDLLARCHEAGVTTSIDFAVTDPLAEVTVDVDMVARWALLTDILSPSFDDLLTVPGWVDHEATSALDAATTLASMGTNIAMVTAGAEGVALCTGSSSSFAANPVLANLPASWHDRAMVVDAHPTSVIRTTGAGDVASAALIHAIASGLEPDAALALVTKAAALHCAGRDDLNDAAYAKEG